MAGLFLTADSRVGTGLAIFTGHHFVDLAYDLNVDGLKEYMNGNVRNEASFQVI